MVADICTIRYKYLSSIDNDIAKEINGMVPIQGHKKYAKLILPVILYECEIRSHIYGRTGHRLTVFENKVLRKILGIRRNRRLDRTA
jgi:hypothetical protein